MKAPFSMSLCACLVFGLALATPFPVQADEKWHNSTTSGVEIDDSLPPLPQPRYRGHFKSPPTGYDPSRIRRFWHKYRVPRDEKPEKPRKLKEE